MAQHIFDNTSRTLSGDDVAEGDIVFVGDSLIEEFIEKVHPQITSQYTLVTHNGDAVITKTLFDQIHDKLLMWYGINMQYTHPKIVPLPLGIENKYFFVNGITTIFDYVEKKCSEKKDKIFYGFSVGAHPVERGAALKNIQINPNGETLTAWRGFFFYLVILNTYKLVLSPPGSCEEGHRTWDTMYIGSVPIVKNSPTTEYYKKIGVPLISVQDWEELQKFDTLFIQTEYDKAIAQSDRHTLTLDYWVNKIKNLES